MDANSPNKARFSYGEQDMSMEVPPKLLGHGTIEDGNPPTIFNGVNCIFLWSRRSLGGTAKKALAAATALHYDQLYEELDMPGGANKVYRLAK